MLQGYSLKYNGVCDVQLNFESYFKLLTNKAMNIFKFSGLPETIDENWLKEQLVLSGKVCFTQFNGTDIYALNGNIGGEPNCYYEPTQFIVANPILGSKQIKVRHKDGSTKVDGLEGIVVSLTNLDQLIQPGFNGGLYNLIYKYAGLLADNDVSLNCAQINGRLNVAFTADNEEEARTAELVLKQYYAGKPYKILTQNILEKISITQIAQSGTNNQIIGLIEAHRSIMGDFFAEIGISYQSNMKRERINEAEIGMMRGQLDIGLTGMLASLKDGIERVNELFGTNITVELNKEVFYDGSGNATLGEEEDISEVKSGSSEVIEETDESKERTEIVEEYKEQGKENENEAD